MARFELFCENNINVGLEFFRWFIFDNHPVFHWHWSLPWLVAPSPVYVGFCGGVCTRRNDQNQTKNQPPKFISNQLHNYRFLFSFSRA